MGYYTIRAEFCDGSHQDYFIKEFGVCGAMHSVLSMITEEEDHAAELRTLTVEEYLND